MLGRTTAAVYGSSVILLMLVGITFAAESKTSAGDKLSRDDANFVTGAAQGGLIEVQLGKVAAEKGSASHVKQFGQRMQKDHSKANEALKKLAH